jgi:hypothetical protein
LWSVLPGAERFNRGGMSLDELISRIRNTNASASFVVSMKKGNPKSIQILSPDGIILLDIQMESAALKREVSKKAGTRFNSIIGVCYERGSGEEIQYLADTMASVLNVETLELDEPGPFDPNSSNKVIIWFQKLDSGKILWTHYHAFDGAETGPRIRIFAVRRNQNIDQ